MKLTFIVCKYHMKEEGKAYLEELHYKCQSKFFPRTLNCLYIYKLEMIENVCETLPLV